MASSLEPDQARHIVGPDLGQNCLETFSADKKVVDCGERVKDSFINDESLAFFLAKRSYGKYS